MRGSRGSGPSRGPLHQQPLPGLPVRWPNLSGRNSGRLLLVCSPSLSCCCPLLRCCGVLTNRVLRVCVVVCQVPPHGCRHGEPGMPSTRTQLLTKSTLPCAAVAAVCEHRWTNWTRRSCSSALPPWLSGGCPTLGFVRSRGCFSSFFVVDARCSRSLCAALGVQGVRHCVAGHHSAAHVNWQLLSQSLRWVSSWRRSLPAPFISSVGCVERCGAGDACARSGTFINHPIHSYIRTPFEGPLHSKPDSCSTRSCHKRSVLTSVSRSASVTLPSRTSNPRACIKRVIQSANCMRQVTES